MRSRISAIVVLLVALAAGTAFGATKPVVNFGVSLRFHPITMYERYQPMMDYLTENTPYRFVLKISRDYKETLRSLKEGKTEVASIGDGGLLKAMLHTDAMPIVKPLNEQGEPVYRSCLVVPMASPIRSVKDLKGKRVAFGYHHSTSGNLVPRCLLLENNISIKDFASYTNLRHHTDVARAVMQGEYDAGFIKESTAIRFRSQGLRVVASSHELPSIPLIARQGTSKQLVESIRKALVRLDRNNPQHRKILDQWDNEYRNGFVAATAADYQGLESMFRKRPYGCSARCHQ
jgi:phosphonate transport system substrate-binding protein